jgi:hypothetical protein
MAADFRNGMLAIVIIIITSWGQMAPILKEDGINLKNAIFETISQQSTAMTAYNSHSLRS